MILDLSPLVFIYEGQTTDQRKQIPTTRGCYILFPLEFDCFIKSITSLWRASCSVAPVAGSDMKKLGWILFSLCDFTKADYSRVNGPKDYVEILSTGRHSPVHTPTCLVAGRVHDEISDF